MIIRRITHWSLPGRPTQQELGVGTSVALVYSLRRFYLIVHPLSGPRVAYALLAFYLFFEGIFEIVNFFRSDPRHGAGCFWSTVLITLSSRDG
jgi:uncharacterized membrane protein HdeD (DUF308 family)